jgi:hypothetical protein
MVDFFSSDVPGLQLWNRESLAVETHASVALRGDLEDALWQSPLQGAEKVTGRPYSRSSRKEASDGHCNRDELLGER